MTTTVGPLKNRIKLAFATDSRGFRSSHEILRWATPGRSGRWGRLEVTGFAPAADYVVVVTSFPRGTLYRLIPPCRRIYVRGEPTAYLPQWPISRWNRWTEISSLFEPAMIVDHASQRRPAYASWHLGLDYDALKTLAVPDKTKALSCVVSNKSFLPGHRRRLQFVERLCRELPAEIDLYGRGLDAERFAGSYRGPLESRRPSPIGRECKLDGLLDYRYSLCLENACEENYYTEKIVDAWLCWSVPIYSGCPNLADYFPAESFIALDIDDPVAVNRVVEQIAEPPSARTIGAIAEARRLALDVYGLLPMLDSVLRGDIAQ
jgi:hypothetical protein